MRPVLSLGSTTADVSSVKVSASKTSGKRPAHVSLGTVSKMVPNALSSKDQRSWK